MSLTQRMIQSSRQRAWGAASHFHSHALSFSLAPLLVLTIAACTPASSPRSRPAEPPAPLPPPPFIPPPQHPIEPTADSAFYTLTATIITTEQAPTPGVADSLTLRETIRARLSPTPGKQLLMFELESDSGYALPTDRAPPPETIRAVRLPARAYASLAWAPDAAVHAATDTSSSCDAVPTVLSDLIAATYLRYLAITHKLATPKITTPDSLHYSTCTAGVSSTHLAVLLPVPDSNDIIDITLSTSSDSSITLPMRVAGQSRGRARFTPDFLGRTTLPLQFTFELESRIQATSDQRAQVFQQRVHILLLRH